MLVLKANIPTCGQDVFVTFLLDNIARESWVGTVYFWTKRSCFAYVAITTNVCMFSRRPCWRAETMKQFYMKIDLISQRRENVLFLASNMAPMTSHEVGKIEIDLPLRDSQKRIVNILKGSKRS